jgi:mevalonate kinase
MRLVSAAMLVTDITAAAPAKLIFSGEHAVVYGCPALATAINRFCQVTITPVEMRARLQVPSPQAPHVLTTPNIVFNFPNFQSQRTFTYQQLFSLYARLQQRYQDFIDNKLAVGNFILSDVTELAVYTFGAFFCQLCGHGVGIARNHGCYGSRNFVAVREIQQLQELPLPTQLQITIASDIPVGCGLGSSAALIVALGYAMMQYRGWDRVLQFKKLAPAEFLATARAIENLQHGRSSGFDLCVSYYGDGIWFQDGSWERRQLPAINLQLVNTGKPQSATGECVEQVGVCFKRAANQHNFLCETFAAVTSALDAALSRGDMVEVQRCVHENHKLLCSIGVVPDKVQSFIAALNQRGMFAKISGAGAVVGENGGIVMVCGTGQTDDLVRQYNYETLLVQREQHGVRLL